MGKRMDYEKWQKRNQELPQHTTVQEGDSWFSLAGKLYGDQRYAGELARANPDVHSLYRGQRLRLPRFLEPGTVPFISPGEMTNWGGGGGQPRGYAPIPTFSSQPNGAGPVYTLQPNTYGQPTTATPAPLPAPAPYSYGAGQGRTWGSASGQMAGARAGAGVGLRWQAPGRGPGSWAGYSTSRNRPGGSGWGPYADYSIGLGAGEARPWRKTPSPGPAWLNRPQSFLQSGRSRETGMTIDWRFT